MSLKNADSSVRIFEDGDALAFHFATYFSELVSSSVNDRGRFSVALSGGSTPKAAFQRLAMEPFASTIPWQSIYFFWGDERCVPPDNSQSNYRMAMEALLSRVDVSSQNIFRIEGELSDPTESARRYSEIVDRLLDRNSDNGEESTGPRFDLILLGLGEDGHTASLFPGTAALDSSDEIVVANYVPKLDSTRITFTLATINNARNVTFLVSGDSKASILKRVLQGGSQNELLPSQLVHPRNGNLIWFVDREAAHLLV